jgi:hypothetical protein
MYNPFRKIQLRDIQGVVAGGTAIINCPKGPRYKYIGLTLGNTAAGNGNAPAVSAIVSDFKIILGTGVQRHFLGTQVDVIHKAMGSEASYGSQAIVTGGANGTGRTLCPIYFEEPWRKRADYQNGLAWQTGFLGTNDVFQLQCAIPAGITPVLSAFAVVDDYYSGNGPSPIMKWFSEQANTNAATLELANFTQGAPANDLLSQISLFATSDAVATNMVRMLLNTNVVMDDITNLQQLAELTNYGMNPDTAGAAFHIPFDHDEMFESLRRVGDITSSSLFLTFAGASAGTITRVTQRLGLPE